MTILSDPPGAQVLLDGEEIGFTPASVDFTYYGTHEITLVKDGYETLKTLQTVPAPWYQVPPLDFLSDNFLLTHITDRHTFLYPLRRSQIVAEEELIERANILRSEARVGP